MAEESGNTLRSWAAIGISVLALLVSGYQAWQSKSQAQLAVTPLVDFYFEDDTAAKNLGLAVENNGPGVAEVKSVRYFVDGKQVQDANAALSLVKIDGKADYGVTLEEGDSLAVGKEVWLFLYRNKRKDQREQLVTALSDRLAVEIEYCAVGGESCRSKCSTTQRCGPNH